MTATIETPQLFTIGEVMRQLQEAGLGRTATVIRRLEERGVVTPLRPIGHNRRLFTPADVAVLKDVIRARDGATEVA